MNTFISQTPKQHRKELRPVFLIYGLLSIMTIVVFLVAFWLFYPYQTITFNKLPYQTEKLEYVQGDTAYYTIDYCKYTDITPTIRKFFVDGLRIQAEEHESKLTPGCRTQRISVKIPKSLPAGKWHVEVESTYQLNPIRTVTTKNETNWFIVTASYDSDLDLMGE
jgi:hypothetical protein